jgi:hypothetical protein
MLLIAAACNEGQACHALGSLRKQDVGLSRRCKLKLAPPA